MRSEDKERVLVEMQSRVAAQCGAAAQAGGLSLDEVVADTVYHELRRCKEQPKVRQHDEDIAFYRDLRRRMQGADDHTLRKLIANVAGRYGEEIAGNFDERVYQGVTKAGLPALGVLLNAVSPLRLMRRFPQLPSLNDAVVVQGELEQLRRLQEIGTVILVPTHVSNLDSLIVGFALYNLGLPPFIYGAGLNLFENPLIGYFMNNLGAYTVDRRKRDPLYKAALKEYATLTLEHDYPNIFFPGGTRARSGAIERHLKLGLLGSGVRAYINNLRSGHKNPKIFIVPTTLSFQLVLEAETLIGDFLKEVGKSRYIITDDEFSKPKRVLDFIRQLFSLDSKIFFTVGRALDPFGNPVDDQGHSLDPQGRDVDIQRYVLQDGEPQQVPQRDAEYTREVGIGVVDAFMRNNVIQTTHVTARAILTLLRRQNLSTDLVRLLRAGGANEELKLRDVYQEVDRLLVELRSIARDNRIMLGPVVGKGRGDEVVEDGLRHFSIYHSEAAATRKGDHLFPTDRSLLFYYSNRLEGYRLEREHGLPGALSDDHRTLRGAK